MPAFVVDTSFAMKWFLADEDDRASSVALLKSMSDTNRPVVPSLWFYEVGNALTMAVRRKRIVLVQLEEILRMLEEMPIDIDPVGSNRSATVASSGAQALADGLRCRLSEVGSEREAPIGDGRYGLEEGRNVGRRRPRLSYYPVMMRATATPQASGRIMVCHPSCPCMFVEGGLFGLAAKAEIRN